MSTEKLKYERPAIRKMNTGLMNKFGTRTEYAPFTHIDGVSITYSYEACTSSTIETEGKFPSFLTSTWRHDGGLGSCKFLKYK